MRRLVVDCEAGLANRLRVLVSGLAMAEATGRTFAMRWGPHPHCGARFSELFSSDVEVREELPESLAEPALFGPNTEQGERLWDLTRVPDDVLYVRSHVWLARPELFPHHAPIRADAVARLDRLEPIAEIRDAVASVVDREFADETVGVHLRRGDFHTELPRSVGNLERVVAEMRRRLGERPKSRFFAATDDGASRRPRRHDPRHEGVKEQLRAAFGDRVFFAQPRSLDRSAPEAVQDALVELLLLRRSDAFIGTEGSSFSQLAVEGRDVPRSML